MIRALAAALLLLTLAAPAPAAAQPATEVCGNRFERFLNGYMIGPGELDRFLMDDAAVSACLAKLKANDDDHVLIAAFLHQARPNPDRQKSSNQFASLCAKGHKLGCAYATAYRPGTAQPTTLAEQLPRLEALADADLPLVNVLLGTVLFQTPATEQPDLGRGSKLLRRAAVQGDYWAQVLLATVAPRDPLNEGDVRLSVRKWRLMAAEHGHLPSMTEVASFAYFEKQFDLARHWYERAANANPALFPSFVSHGRYMLGVFHKDGIGAPADAQQARRWFAAAAALGHEQAKKELQRMQSQAQPHAPITPATLDAVFAQTPRIAKFDRQPVMIYVKAHDGVPDLARQAVAAELQKATAAINASTGLSLHLFDQPQHAHVWVDLAPTDAIRAVIAKLPQAPRPANAPPPPLCFATRTSPPGEFNNIHGIHRAVLHVPADQGAAVIADCVNQALPEALGYRRPPTRAAGLDPDTLAALAVIYDPRVRANMSRADVAAIFGLR